MHLNPSKIYFISKDVATVFISMRDYFFRIYNRKILDFYYVYINS